jgi:hypothetical protein
MKRQAYYPDFKWDQTKRYSEGLVGRRLTYRQKGELKFWQAEEEEKKEQKKSHYTKRLKHGRQLVCWKTWHV